MRKLFRVVAPVIAATAIALGSGSAALAAAPTSMSLDANWCFPDGIVEYCFDVDGRVQFLDNKVGSSVTVNEITRTTYYVSGQYAGESMSVEMFRGVFQADGTDVMQSAIHTRSTAFGEDCSYHLTLRIADYETVVYQVNSTCGG
jgi:hypothetical protein